MKQIVIHFQPGAKGRFVAVCILLAKGLIKNTKLVDNVGSVHDAPGFLKCCEFWCSLDPLPTQQIVFTHELKSLLELSTNYQIIQIKIKKSFNEVASNSFLKNYNTECNTRRTNRIQSWWPNATDNLINPDSETSSDTVISEMESHIKKMNEWTCPLPCKTVYYEDLYDSVPEILKFCGTTVNDAVIDFVDEHKRKQLY